MHSIRADLSLAPRGAFTMLDCVANVGSCCLPVWLPRSLDSEN